MKFLAATAALVLLMAPAPAIAMPNAFWIFGFRFPAGQKAKGAAPLACAGLQAGVAKSDAADEGKTAPPASQSSACSDMPQTAIATPAIPQVASPI